MYTLILDIVPALIGGAVGLLVGGCVVIILIVTTAKIKRKLNEETTREKQQLRMELESKFRDETRRLVKESETKLRDKEEELRQWERRLSKKEDVFYKKMEIVEQREKESSQRENLLRIKEHELEKIKGELQRVVEEEKKTLLTISGLTKEEATKMILTKLEKELIQEQAGMIKKFQEKMKETVGEEAKRVLAVSIQRFAANHTAEITVSTVDLPNDDMKGRIIGRDGRNIRSFERVTGVDLIVDDTPGVIVLSSFDGVRREIARRAMVKLVLDGRIHPGRIEEVVEETKREMEQDLYQIGKNACEEVGIVDVPPKIVSILGRLQYRTSYGQNVLAHSLEVANLCGLLAAELKLDSVLAKRCGLLHDIGKAIDHEVEGSHPVVGAEILKRVRERSEVIESAEKHHEDITATSLYTVITSAADAISASRPGARKESFEKYLRRLKKLEEIATSFPGVESAFAIQAGREIRVIVDSAKVDDNQAIIICRNIANEIEKETNYPGEIRVTLIREKRFIEYAR